MQIRNDSNGDIQHTKDRAVPVSPWGQDLGTRDSHFYAEHPWYPIFSLAVFHVGKSEFTAGAAQ